jgi:methionyl-tRNA formyltransferase
LHFSILPRHRGVAPVAWAILEGDARTGVTTMRMDEGVDTGPVFLVQETPIAPDDTQGTLTARLAEMGAPLLVETLERVERGGISAQPQANDQATLARRLEKEDGRIDWRFPARVIERRVRALDPWPGTFTTFRGSPLKILRTSFVARSIPPGLLLVDRDRPIVGTGEEAIELVDVQSPGKNRTSGVEWLRGARVREGETLGDAGS